VATSVVVVVLPWVPPTAMFERRRISSASMSARRTTGRPRARAPTSSGLSARIALEITTTSASARFASRWPSKMRAPRPASLSVIGVARRSDPCTR
jgi:hypothetical protein